MFCSLHQYLYFVPIHDYSPWSVSIHFIRPCSVFSIHENNPYSVFPLMTTTFTLYFHPWQQSSLCISIHDNSPYSVFPLMISLTLHSHSWEQPKLWCSYSLQQPLLCVPIHDNSPYSVFMLLKRAVTLYSHSWNIHHSVFPFMTTAIFLFPIQFLFLTTVLSLFQLPTAWLSISNHDSSSMPPLMTTALTLYYHSW